MTAKHTTKTGLWLGLYAIIGTGVVALTFENTYNKTKENERLALLHTLHSLVPQKDHNNDMFTDKISVTSKKHLGSTLPSTIYRARMNNKPVAAVLSPIAPDGYNGQIKLLVAVDYSGNIIGVRVISHKETPGLGDAIESRKSNWIKQFENHSLSNPGSLGWKVKQDGGDFDQITGATITPRAIVKSIYSSLQFYEINKELIYKPANKNETEQ